MFDRYLLAIDDSPATPLATAFAVALAKRTASSVHVFHAREYLVGGNGLMLHTRQEASELVTGAVLELRAAGVHASGSSVVATYRDVPRRIAETAGSGNVGAIVLGSNRGGLLRHLFSPRVRERIIRLTALPVFTAPSPLDLDTLTMDEMVLSAGWHNSSTAALDLPPMS